MSLSEAVLEIAEEMMREAQATPDRSSDVRLNLFARQLQIAVKASGGVPALESHTQAASVFLHPEAQHFQMVEQARRELREAKRKGDLQEGGEPRFAVCQGGPADGDTVVIAPEMPPGAKSLIDGRVYVLSSQGALVFEEGMN